MKRDFLWWRDGIIYQIYIRSFKDTNNDGVGDLNGIISELDYLKELGVDALWLSPLYPSPDVDYGYDVCDYRNINPQYGSMDDFNLLIKEAHQRKIHIILDIVLNHTSNQHPWFLESKKAKDNSKRDWYIWRDKMNNWESIFGGSGWELDETTNEYYFHMFYKEQPDVNWRNPQLRKEMIDILDFWLKKGVDGFRFDVFNAFFKKKDFSDNPSKAGIRGFDRQSHINDIDQPEMDGLLEEIRSLIDRNPERFTVGETFLGGPEKAAKYCGDHKMHETFNFDFLKCNWSPKEFMSAIQKWENVLPEDGHPSYVLNNHDNPRSATRYARGENDERLKILAALLITLRGTPFMYYGEEIGMRDIKVSRNQIKDPVGKRYWPFYSGRDGCRAPMQWDTTKNAGFSKEKPWLNIHPDYMERNVVMQREDKDSLFHFYKDLIRLRHEETSIRDGLFLPLIYEPRSIMAYLRQSGDDMLMVVMNFGWRSMRFFIGNTLKKLNWKVVLNNQEFVLPEDRSTPISLKANQVVILKPE